MSEQNTWNNSGLQVEETSSGTRSSQETLCNPDNFEDGVAQPVPQATAFNKSSANSSFTSQSNEKAMAEVSEAWESKPCGQPDAFQPLTLPLGFNPEFLMDEDTQMFYDGSPAVESPRDVTSPGEPGDVSSPYDGAMESDFDESLCGGPNASGRRAFPTWNMNLSTTTPPGSSDDEDYSSCGSKKKRRKTRRDVPVLYSDRYHYGSQNSSQIPSPSPSGGNENEDANTSAVAQALRNRQFPNFSLSNNSDSTLHATILNANRRMSNASESSQGGNFSKDSQTVTMDSQSQASLAFNADTGTGTTLNPCDINDTFKKNSTSRRRPTHHHHHKTVGQNTSVPALNINHPSSACGYSLKIVNQPETQHRARYLTEGSRGPVKDSSQQGYPQVELEGYTGKTTLHVYVGSDSDDKIRPHGFYQACKVTGRNTTACEEVEVEGTKVIHIPFNVKEGISVDCVGILKLRNADVEARIGVSRAKKRSQTVRLVFRVILDDVERNDGISDPLVLQVVSNRINCTQPLGQPEITKKSLERCSVEGGMEMFIIGRNFHRGIKVVFQDPEEADGSHWHTVGQLDKDTFNQSHMVVSVPPYHNLDIQKPINVQVFVEHNGKKCDPHSFTYDPLPAVQAANAERTATDSTVKDSGDPVKALLEGGKLDKKLLEALFARLLTSTEVESNDIKPVPRELKQTSSVFSPTQPLVFTTGVQIDGGVSKPVPTQSWPSTVLNNVVKPNTFVGISPLLANVKPNTMFSNTGKSLFVTSQQPNLTNSGDQPHQNQFQQPENIQNLTNSVGSIASLVVKTENTSSEPGFPNQQVQGTSLVASATLSQNQFTQPAVYTNPVAHSASANTALAQSSQTVNFFKLSTTTLTSAGQQQQQPWPQQTNASSSSFVHAGGSVASSFTFPVITTSSSLFNIAPSQSITFATNPINPPVQTSIGFQQQSFATMTNNPSGPPTSIYINPVQQGIWNSSQISQSTPESNDNQQLQTAINTICNINSVGNNQPQQQGFNNSGTLFNQGQVLQANAVMSTGQFNNGQQQNTNQIQQNTNHIQQNTNQIQQNTNPVQQNINPVQQNINPVQQNTNSVQNMSHIQENAGMVYSSTVQQIPNNTQSRFSNLPHSTSFSNPLIAQQNASVFNSNDTVQISNSESGSFANSNQAACNQQIQNGNSSTDAPFSQSNQGLSFNAEVLGNQQQVFTVSESLHILENSKSALPHLDMRTSTPLHPNAGMGLLSPNSVSGDETSNMPDSLNSPIVSADTGLSMGFGTNLSINDSMELNSSRKELDMTEGFQSLISDCNPSVAALEDDNAAMLQMPMIDRNNYPPVSMFNPPASTPQLQPTSNEPQLVQFQQAPVNMFNPPASTPQLQPTTNEPQQIQFQQPPVGIFNPQASTSQLQPTTNEQQIQFQQASEADMVRMMQTQSTPFTVPLNEIQKDQEQHMSIADLSKFITNEVMDTDMFLVNPSSIQTLETNSQIPDEPVTQASTHLVFSDASSTNTHLFNDQLIQQESQAYVNTPEIKSVPTFDTLDVEVLSEKYSPHSQQQQQQQQQSFNNMNNLESTDASSQQSNFYNIK